MKKQKKTFILKFEGRTLFIKNQIIARMILGIEPQTALVRVVIFN